MNYCNVPIIDNLHPGDCGLWYDVQALVKGKLIHHVCPYSECSTFMEAIQYYMDTFFKENHVPVLVTHHRFSAFTLKQMAKAC